MDRDVRAKLNQAILDRAELEALRQQVKELALRELEIVKLREALEYWSQGRHDAKLNSPTTTEHLEAFRTKVIEECAALVNLAGQGFCGSNVEIVFNTTAESIRELKKDKP